MDLPKSANAYTLEEAIKVAKDIGFPVISRASFTLAGGGSGVYNMDEFKALAAAGLEASQLVKLKLWNLCLDGKSMRWRLSETIKITVS